MKVAEGMLLDKLPPVRGRLQEKANLAIKSRWGVGGPAEVLFVPEDLDDLVFFLSNIDDDLPITVLGFMSNVLIRSGGIDGVVIILSNWFRKAFVEDGIFEVGAIVGCSELSTMAMNHELGGLEFLMGLPGSIGGAIKMNAGCYGSEISDVLLELEGVSRSGKIRWLKNSDLDFRYRNSGISNDLIITRAWFRGIRHADYSVHKKIHEINKKREEAQPIHKKTCGSTFKNPEGIAAWELIHKAGCRGMRIGGASVSDKHCNFIINDNNATADDIENLALKVANKVHETFGVVLEWEVVRLGKKRSSDNNG
ncbi:MAG: UDP-N-acetylmuramate dehydrogenase [Holosporaceae bacterium]|jgi:UDP-N-acetylmuramate dehydrogenase|nr:UDP-N-acetylmuramate dehydrogenase [Holosporaceae bacterium]